MKTIRAIALVILLFTLCITIVSCGEGSNSSSASEKQGNVRITFAEAIDAKRINDLNGSTVEIVGYMATVSPVSGKYIYLMNLPYQSCPFCVPNTQQLSNTIAVYAKEGKTFAFTDGPINVCGTLETGDFKDEYGYTYNYRIANATYTAVNSSDASEKLALWSRITDAGIASDVYSMFDYIDFECQWYNYVGQFEEGSAYLYPGDVKYFEEKQFAKQSASNYFTSLTSRVKGIKDDRMNELVNIIGDGEKLVEKAKAERSAENYVYIEEEDRFMLNIGEELRSEAQKLYTRFALWLENFSLSTN